MEDVARPWGYADFSLRRMQRFRETSGRCDTPVMRLELTWSACGQRLSAVLTGPVTYADRSQALAAVCQEAAARGIRQFLIDFSLAWHMLGEPDDKPVFFENLRRRAELANTRIAYVTGPEGNVAELLSVAEDVGFAAQMFRDRSSAIAWLAAVDSAESKSFSVRPRVAGG